MSRPRSPWELVGPIGGQMICKSWEGTHFGHLWQWPLVVDCRTSMKVKPRGCVVIVCARCRGAFSLSPKLEGIIC